MGHILRTAENKYGARDKEYTILGVEVIRSEQPQIWFPGNCKNIAIQLTYECLEDMDQAVYQLSHEVVHCLSPTGRKNVSLLEEGLATHFAEEYTYNNGHGCFSSNLPNYKTALTLYEELVKIDKDIIKKVREIQPTISLITSNDLLSVNDKIPKELALQLEKKFN